MVERRVARRKEGEEGDSTSESEEDSDEEDAWLRWYHVQRKEGEEGDSTSESEEDSDEEVASKGGTGSAARQGQRDLGRRRCPRIARRRGPSCVLASKPRAATAGKDSAASTIEAAAGRGDRGDRGDRGSASEAPCVSIFFILAKPPVGWARTRMIKLLCLPMLWYPNTRQQYICLSPVSYIAPIQWKPNH